MIDIDEHLTSKAFPLGFWDTLDKSITKQEPRIRHLIKLYPSEASAVVTNEYGETETIGGCLRKSWFRGMLQRLEATAVSPNIDAVLSSEPFTASAMWKFAVSKYAETAIIDEAKRANVYETNSLRFEWELPFTYTKFPALVSGELDLAVFIPSEDGQVELPLENKAIVGIEVKSISGYKGPRTVFGVKSKKGHWLSLPEPKSDHLLQATLYHMFFCLHKKEYKYWKLAYLNREDGARKEFDIDLVPEVTEDGFTLHRVYVDRKPYKYELYGESILYRYEQLHRYLESEELPPRDFDLYYDDAKIAAMAKTNRLSKVHMELFKKKKKVKKGDWQCSYCPFKDICYLPDGNPRTISSVDSASLNLIKDSLNEKVLSEEDDSNQEFETET